MQARGGLRYNLDEILFILQSLENDKTLEEVALSLDRSKNGLRAKFASSKPLEDGRTSLRGVRQYKNTKELYSAFGEVLPSDPQLAREDILNRVSKFKATLGALKRS